MRLQNYQSYKRILWQEIFEYRSPTNADDFRLFWIQNSTRDVT